METTDLRPSIIDASLERQDILKRLMWAAVSVRIFPAREVWEHYEKIEELAQKMGISEEAVAHATSPSNNLKLKAVKQSDIDFTKIA